MKKFLTASVLFAATTLSAYGADLCSRYYGNARYMKAIETLAAYQEYSVEEFCNLPRVWDLQVAPSRIINRQGEIIPHVQIQQHYEFSSCLFMINETDYSLSSSKCYSGT